MILALLIAAAAPQLSVAEHNRRMAAYRHLPVRPCEAPMTPRDAIWAAAEAEGAPVEGCFEVAVAAVGGDRGSVYLNSEGDYRDPRNLTIRLARGAAADLAALIGAVSLGDALIGRPVTVRGRVIRRRIDFTGPAGPTGKYYYQTYVLVDAAAQVARPVPPPF